jgi:hypothetical protein
MTAVSDQIVKVYVQGPIKRSEEEYYTLLPTLLSAGFQQPDIVCSPLVDTSLLKCENVFNIYDPFLQRGPIPPFSPDAAHLPLSKIAQMFTFATIAQAAAALDAPDTSAIIILDSRAVARRDFFARVKDLVEKESCTEWECLSLAHTPKALPEAADASYFSDPQLFQQDPMTPITVGAVAMRLSFVRKLVKTIIPFRDPLEYELLFQTLLHKAGPHYIYPPVFDCR